VDPLPAIILLPPAGQSAAEQFVAQGKFFAAVDLLDRLQQSQAFDPIYCAAAEANQQKKLIALGAQPAAVEAESFHFGQALTGLIQTLNLDRVAYFGGASAPLASKQMLRQAVRDLNDGGTAVAIVNNFHSTDWALISDATALLGSSDRLPSDNALGWILRNDLHFEVTALPPSAATRMDIDTPSDIFLSAVHANAGAELQAFAESSDKGWMDRLRAIRQVLNEPGNTLTIIGRSSSHAWRELERKTQVWVRMFVEERGMTASGRLKRGEVRSILGGLLDQVGAIQFVARLAEISSGVLWDTRVWMAARGSWPSASDRFAADLGWTDQVEDQHLRELSETVHAAAIPILTGGHGIVSGGIYALLESTTNINKNTRLAG
jgi:hypothetical protein